MQRLAIVMSHASRSMGGAIRDAIFARALRSLGVDARMFRMHGGAEIERDAVLEGAVPVTFCPADDPQDHPHRQVSAALRAELAAFAPELVLYKGLGYRVNADCHAALPAGTQAGLVVGGGVTDPLLDSAVLVLGEYTEQLAIHFRAQFAAGRAMVLPKHVDLAAAGDGLPAPRGRAEFDIANIGTFAETRKNQSALLPLAARHRVVCIGGGPRLAELRRAARGNTLLTLTGRLPHAQVFETLRRSRILVHTSTMDGLPRATIEAMACGLPVVAYRRTIPGGIPLGAGLLVAEAALEPAVDMLLADDAMRLRWGRAARRYVAQHHGTAAIEACAAKVLRLVG